MIIMIQMNILMLNWIFPEIYVVAMRDHEFEAYEQFLVVDAIGVITFKLLVIAYQ